ncbi:MAG: hypothetical protein NC337_04820 [Roseburia sp.]|nr:hypothetical protein [Roseburia sp.]
MANISFNNFFNALSGTSANSFYSNLNDASLIKSGSYRKLMKSYFSTADSAGKTTASDKKSASDTDTRTKKEIKNTVLDDLLKHETKSTAKTNGVLDELLNPEKKKSTIQNKVLDELLGEKNQTVSTTEDGAVVDKTETAVSAAKDSGSVIDTAI